MWSCSLYVSFLSPNAISLAFSFSSFIIYTLYTRPPNAFLFSLSGFCRKNVLTHGKDFLALGLVVRSGRGKFSGSDPDGTCGCVGSHCSLVPLQRFGLEIPLPMPSQHHKSSATMSGWSPGRRHKQMAALLCIYIDRLPSYFLQSCVTYVTVDCFRFWKLCLFSSVLWLNNRKK